MGVEVETTGDQCIESVPVSFPGGFCQVGLGNGAVLRSDEYAGASFDVAFGKMTDGGYVLSGSAFYCGEGNPVFPGDLMDAG